MLRGGLNMPTNKGLFQNLCYPKPAICVVTFWEMIVLDQLERAPVLRQHNERVLWHFSSAEATNNYSQLERFSPTEGPL